MMRRFDCPDCGKFLGRTDGTTLEAKCTRCRAVVTALPLDLQLALECARCSRRHHYENPASRPRYCVVCGAETLVPVLRPAEAPTPVMIERQSNSTAQH